MKKEFELLKSIVENTFNVELSSKYKTDNHVRARCIYNKISFEHIIDDYLVIGESINRDRITIMHSLENSFEQFNTTTFKKRYDYVEKTFLKFLDNDINIDDVNNRTIERLNNDILILKLRIEKLLKDNKELKHLNKNISLALNLDKKSKTRRYKKYKKTVLRFDKDGNFIDKFDNAKDASIKLGLNHGVINDTCNGRQNTYKGFIFRYA